MRALLIGGDNPIGAELGHVFARTERHEAARISMASARWTSEREAKRVARRSRPEAIIDLRLPQILASGEPVTEPDVERAHWLAKACERSGLIYLYLSCGDVFSGNSTTPYREGDPPDNDSETGRLLRHGEALVRGACSRAMVLRLGGLFAGTDLNWLTRILNWMLADRVVVLDNSTWRSPTEAGDAARVVAAIVDQLSVGARAWDTFHYCSGERATRYQFAEAALAAASQFEEMSDVSVRTPKDQEEPASRGCVLDCSGLRDTFAIRQMGWRRVMAQAVRQYFEAREREKDVRHG